MLKFLVCLCGQLDMTFTYYGTFFNWQPFHLTELLSGVFRMCYPSVVYHSPVSVWAQRYSKARLPWDTIRYVTTTRNRSDGCPLLPRPHLLTACTRCRQRGRDPDLPLLTLSSVYGNEWHHNILGYISGLFPDGRKRLPHLSLFSLQHWSWPINLDFSQVVGGWAVIKECVIVWWAYD